MMAEAIIDRGHESNAMSNAGPLQSNRGDDASLAARTCRDHGRDGAPNIAGELLCAMVLCLQQSDRLRLGSGGAESLSSWQPSTWSWSPAPLTGWRTARSTSPQPG